MNSLNIVKKDHLYSCINVKFEYSFLNHFLTRHISSKMFQLIFCEKKNPNLPGKCHLTDQIMLNAFASL